MANPVVQKKMQSPMAGWFPRLLVLITLAFLGLLVTVPIEWKDQAAFGFGTFVLASWVNRRFSQYTATLVLIFLSVFSTSRYAYWRFSETYRHLAGAGWSNIGWDVIFVGLLLLAEVYAIVILLLGYFQSLKPLGRPAMPLPRNLEEWPSVDVFIPTYNEPLDVVRPTVLAALCIDWPAEKIQVFILDDGRRAEFKEFAEECGCGYMIRPDNKHAKAGNINYALKQTKAEYIAIFDCDHIPTRSFLQVTMGWFLADPQLAMVQTPHYFYTPDPFEKNLGIFKKVPNEGALFYGVVQDANDFWNATFFCGSCAAIRRTALEEIGGIAVETVTEDAHTALRMQRLGWNTAYIRIPQAAGLATSSLADHIGQRIRWARGMVQILRIDCPLFGKGLKLSQRLCYLNSTLHYLYALPRLIFLTAPLVYLLLHRSNVYGYVATILAYAFPHLALATLTNSRIQGRHRYSFWNEVYEAVLAPYILLPTMAALVSPRHGKFNVTPKSHGSDRSYIAWKVAAPFLVLLALNTAGVVMGALRMLTEPEHQGPLAMNMFWASINMLIMGASVAVASEKRQRRHEARLLRQYPARLILSDGRVFSGETADLSNGGAAVTMEDPLDLPEGLHAMLLIEAPGEELAVPVSIAGLRGQNVRLAFLELSVDQRQAITRLIFSAADLWVLGHVAQERDKPLKSLFHVLGVAFRGLFLIPKALVSSPDQEEDETKPRSLRTRRASASLPLLIGFALSSLLTLPRTAQAQTSAAPLSTGPAASSTLPSFDEARDLRMLGVRQPIVLRGLNAQASVAFSVSVTKVANLARLGLNYQLSPQLDASSSTLQVTLNGSPVATLPLERTSTPGASYSHLQVDLPAELLVSQNTLTLQLNAKCSNCSENDAEIQTTIDTSSTIRMAGDVIPLPNELTLLPAPFFDANAQQTVEVAFVLPPNADSVTLRAAALVASYFGVLADNRSIRFPVSTTAIPKGNVVVVMLNGAASALGLRMDGVAGATVAMRDNPSDASGKILVVSGDNGDQILAAARAVAMAQASQKGDTLAVSNIKIPAQRKAYDAPRWTNSDRNIRLGDTATAEQLRVNGSGPVRWYFRLPADLYFGQRETVPLRLHFRYAQLPRGAHAEVRVRMNGVQVGVRRLENVASNETFSETVEIPVVSLYPRNTLTVDFSYVDDPSRRVAAPVEPVGMVLRDSELDLRGVPHFTTLPRLDVFAKAGFPFTRMSDLSDTAIVLPPQPSAQELSACLEMMGFFGAQTGMPGFYVDVLESNAIQRAGNKDLLLISAGGDHPLMANWANGMPISVGRSGLGLNRPSTPWLRFLSLPFLPSGREWSRLSDALATEPNPPLLIQSFVSPLNPGRSVVAISAVTPAGLDGLADLLERSSQNEGISGVVSLQVNGRFDSFRLTTENYVIGELEWRQAFYYWVGRYLWLVPVIVLTLALMLAQQLAKWVEWRANERLRVEAQ